MEHLISKKDEELLSGIILMLFGTYCTLLDFYNGIDNLFGIPNILPQNPLSISYNLLSIEEKVWSISLIYPLFTAFGIMNFISSLFIFEKKPYILKSLKYKLKIKYYYGILEYIKWKNNKM